MRKRRRTWFLRRMVLGLAVAAILVPTAQARPDEGGAPVEPPYVPFKSDFPQPVVDPPLSGPGYSQFGFTRALPKDYGVRTVQLVQRDGFDWSDAGIGAGSALVLVLLAGGASLATRHVGRAATA